MKADILGVKIDNLKEKEVIYAVRKKIAKKEKFWIATPNPEMIVLAQKDLQFKRILNSADLAIPDGIGLVWAGRILGREIRERVSGVDLMEKLCQVGSQNGWSVYLIGGKPEVAKTALEVLKKRYPGLKGWAETGPELEVGSGKWEVGRKKGGVGSGKWIEKINQKEPTILFVGFGMGKQERWVAKYFDILNIGGAMVVGGAFDFISGRALRAPILIQDLGLEWLWRLIQEPWRIKRQLALGRFVFLVLKERLSLL
ncbi:MAG: WecB/TagA/CpsF family glycosyltransferase [Patescibacteria group bacterium]